MDLVWRQERSDPFYKRILCFYVFNVNKRTFPLLSEIELRLGVRDKSARVLENTFGLKNREVT